MKHLAKANADVNVQDSKSGKTALHHCIEKGDLPMAGFLVMEVGRERGRERGRQGRKGQRRERERKRLV